MTMKPEFPIGTTHSMVCVDYSSSEDGGRKYSMCWLLDFVLNLMYRGFQIACQN